jgi:ABC-2 type transport system permease protein
MIQKIFSIAWLYLRITFSQRAVFIFSFAMPLVFTLVLSFAIQGPGDPPKSWQLAVVDDDGGTYAQAFIQRLEDDPIIVVTMMDEAAARTAVEDEDIVGAVQIPGDFSTALAAGESAALTYYNNGDDLADSQILEQAITAAYGQLSGSLAAGELAVSIGQELDLFSIDGAPEPAELFEATFLEAEAGWAEGAPVKVDARQATLIEDAQDDVPLGAGQSSPGMLVMYALFFTFGGGTSLLVEREDGTLRRLLVMPLSKGTIMAGKLLGIFIGAIIQMAVMVLAGQFLFGVNWGQDPAALTAMLLGYGFVGTTLGLMVAALTRTAAQANSLGTIIIMALASLGGAWWPIEIVPEWMRQAAQGLPTYWAMQGFQDIITRGLSFEAILPELAALMAFGSAFLLIGVWRFRYE